MTVSTADRPPRELYAAERGSKEPGRVEVFELKNWNLDVEFYNARLNLAPSVKFIFSLRDRAVPNQAHDILRIPVYSEMTDIIWCAK